MRSNPFTARRASTEMPNRRETAHNESPTCTTYTTGVGVAVGVNVGEGVAKAVGVFVGSADVAVKVGSVVAVGERILAIGLAVVREQAAMLSTRITPQRLNAPRRTVRIDIASWPLCITPGRKVFIKYGL
jgi:hypothetical protein